MAANSDSSILKVDGLNIYYGTLHAVQNVSFDVKKGEIFGLLGPNGAGKTSTLGAIEGLLKFSSGSIFVDGIDAAKNPLKARASLGVQLQATSFQPELYIREIIALYAGIYGMSISPQEISSILKELSLEDAGTKRFGELSGGQQQRISLYISTIHNPRLVLLDEPTTGLDPQSRRKLWERIENIKALDHAVVLTTHSMEEAEAVCDRVAIIDHGKILVMDDPAILIEQYRNDPEVISLSRKGKITLEDIFIALTGREIRA